MLDVRQAAAADISARSAQLPAMYSLPNQPMFQMLIGLGYGLACAALFSAWLRRYPGAPREPGARVG